MRLCESHRERGFAVPAAKIVAGTPMCAACIAGKAVSMGEMCDVVASRPDLVHRRRYYAANRERVLSKRRRRKAGKSSYFELAIIAAHMRLGIRGRLMGSLQSAAPAELDCSVAGPSFCISHFDRAGVQIPAVHIVEGEGFCSSLLRGRPIVSSRKSFVLDPPEPELCAEFEAFLTRPRRARPPLEASPHLTSSAARQVRERWERFDREMRAVREKTSSLRATTNAGQFASKEFNQTTYRPKPPLPALPPPIVPAVDQPRHRYATRAQLAALLAQAKAARERDWILLLVSFWHGLRASEAINLTPENFSDGFLDRAAAERIAARTVQPLVEDKDELLNEKKALEDWISRHAALHGPAGALRLFPVSRFHFYRLMRRYGRLAGLPERLCHPHVLKHSIAMQLFWKGGTENARKYLGMSSGLRLPVSNPRRPERNCSSSSSSRFTAVRSARNVFVAGCSFCLPLTLGALAIETIARNPRLKGQGYRYSLQMVAAATG